MLTLQVLAAWSALTALLVFYYRLRIFCLWKICLQHFCVEEKFLCKWTLQNFQQRITCRQYFVCLIFVHCNAYEKFKLRKFNKNGRHHWSACECHNVRIRISVTVCRLFCPGIPLALVQFGWMKLTAGHRHTCTFCSALIRALVLLIVLTMKMWPWSAVSVHLISC